MLPIIQKGLRWAKGDLKWATLDSVSQKVKVQTDVLGRVKVRV